MASWKRCIRSQYVSGSKSEKKKRNKCRVVIPRLVLPGYGLQYLSLQFSPPEPELGFSIPPAFRSTSLYSKEGHPRESDSPQAPAGSRKGNIMGPQPPVWATSIQHETCSKRSEEPEEACISSLTLLCSGNLARSKAVWGESKGMELKRKRSMQFFGGGKWHWSTSI